MTNFGFKFSLVDTMFEKFLSSFTPEDGSVFDSMIVGYRQT
jgi:hypothetical protein